MFLTVYVQFLFVSVRFLYLIIAGQIFISVKVKGKVVPVLK
jgi:hypothetical protein